jgi:hypothetical protein
VILEYDNIVVGSSLAAVLFAFNNQYPILFTEADRPFRFDYLEPTLDLSCLKIPGVAKSLTTFRDEKKVGVTKEILWERLLFLLSLNGHVPLSDLCASMRWDGNTLTCSSDYGRIANIGFEQCYFFGDEGCHKLVEFKETKSDFLVYDWIAFNKGGKHEIDYLKTEDDFVSEIWFYPSDRIDGKTPVKDACAISTLKQKDLLSFDFSETMARFKTIFEMEQRGMKGLFASIGPNGNPKHYKFKTSTIGRQKVKVSDPAWEESAKVKKAPVDLCGLLEQLPETAAKYDLFIKNL